MTAPPAAWHPDAALLETRDVAQSMAAEHVRDLPVPDVQFSAGA